MRRSHLDHTPRELVSFIALGASLAAAALLGVAWAAGFGAVAHRLSAVDAIWVPIALAAEALAYVGYVLAYREVARVEGGPHLPPSKAIALVTTGFGAFVARGGFALDLHAFRQEVDDREARVRVLGLGALEYALLAPATCIVAIMLLVDHVHKPASARPRRPVARLHSRAAPALRPPRASDRPHRQRDLLVRRHRVPGALPARL
jgi:hypothetical protein